MSTKHTMSPNMNFLKALQHAFIGYGIRRKAWREEAILYFDLDGTGPDDGLRWMQSGPHDATRAFVWPDISYEDMGATDWEVI